VAGDAVDRPADVAGTVERHDAHLDLCRHGSTVA
jgi:hypothetical protein